MDELPHWTVELPGPYFFKCGMSNIPKKVNVGCTLHWVILSTLLRFNHNVSQSCQCSPTQHWRLIAGIMIYNINYGYNQHEKNINTVKKWPLTLQEIIKQILVSR